MTAISSLVNISTKDIESGKLVSKLPELYELKEVMENNPWHKNESAFIHTLRVLDNLDDIFKFDLLDDTKRKHILTTLERHVVDGKYSKKTLLRLAALLHDLGKKETFKKNPNGITYAPKHEAKSAEIVPKIAKRFHLNQNEINYLKTIIIFHTEATIAASNAISEKKKIGREKIEELKIKLENCFTELLLLTLADHRTSLEKENAPDQYEQKEVFLIDEIAKSIQ